jgi:CHASE3 domain sensor protein
MTTDNPITPTADQVQSLYEWWQFANRSAARRFDIYNTAKATHDAANDTGRILDEAIAARKAALDAYSVTRATHYRANIAAAEAIIARDAANVANSTARNAYRDSIAAGEAAREAHDEATR